MSGAEMGGPLVSISDIDSKSTIRILSDEDASFYIAYPERAARLRKNAVLRANRPPPPPEANHLAYPLHTKRLMAMRMIRSVKAPRLAHGS